MSNFTDTMGYVRGQVFKLNEAFGNVRQHGNTPSFVKQVSLVVEETKETIEALKKEDWKEVADGFGDFYTVIFGCEYVHDIGFLPIGFVPNALYSDLSDVDASVQFLSSQCEQYLDANEVGFEFDVYGAINAMRTLYMAMGNLYARLNMFDILDVYDEVHRSNMTKFISDDECLQRTILKYRQMGVPEDHLIYTGEPGQLRVVVAKHFVLDGKIFPVGKFLKGADFQTPRFVLDYVMDDLNPDLKHPRVYASGS